MSYLLILLLLAFHAPASTSLSSTPSYPLQSEQHVPTLRGGKPFGSPMLDVSKVTRPQAAELATSPAAGEQEKPQRQRSREMSKPSLLQIDSADVQKQVEDFIKSAAELLQQTEELLRPRSGHSVTRLAQRNRLLVQRAKILRLQSVDPSTHKKIDEKIAQLEAAWNAYAQISPLETQESLTAVPMEVKAVSSLVSEEDEMRANKKRVPVTFTVSCNYTDVGDQLLLIGDQPELGSWNPLASVLMTTTPTMYPLWQATVDLPAGEVIEYKYAIGTPGMLMGQYDVKEWEAHMGNRIFKVPRKANERKEEFVIPDHLHGENPDHRSPHFVHMQRMDSTDCFMDPEYACVF